MDEGFWSTWLTRLLAHRDREVAPLDIDEDTTATTSWAPIGPASEIWMPPYAGFLAANIWLGVNMTDPGSPQAGWIETRLSFDSGAVFSSVARTELACKVGFPLCSLGPRAGADGIPSESGSVFAKTIAWTPDLSYLSTVIPMQFEWRRSAFATGGVLRNSPATVDPPRPWIWQGAS